MVVNLFTPKFKKYILPTFKECISESSTIGSMAFIWVTYEKPSSPYCVNVIVLKLQGKFEISHCWWWKRYNRTPTSAAVTTNELYVFLREAA